jgi:hypothetical protein
MNKNLAMNLAIVLLASLTLSVSFQPARAQSFSSHGDGNAREKPLADVPLFDTKNLFQKSFDDFTDSLDATSARMRKDYDDSMDATREIWKLENQTNEINNGSTLNVAFQKTPAQALNSDGLNNTPLVGAVGAASPVRGGFIAPNMQGRFQFYGSSPQSNGKSGGAKKR